MLHHCLATNCIGKRVQEGFLMTALTYKTMGCTIDESVRLTFAQSGTSIRRQEQPCTTTITNSQPLQKDEEEEKSQNAEPQEDAPRPQSPVKQKDPKKEKVKDEKVKKINR